MMKHTPRFRKGAPLIWFSSILGLTAPPPAGGQQAGLPSAAIQRSIPAAPDPRHVFVYDSAHLLSAAGIRALQDSAQELQSATGADIAFVTLPTLHGGSVEEAALTIGRRWKIGSSGALGDPQRARGLVMLYVPDRASVAGPNLRVEVGRGLEGAITDGGGSRAILEALKPGLRAKHYDEGFVRAFNSAAQLIRSERPATVSRAAPTPPPSSGFPWPVLFPFFLLVIGLVVFIWFINRRGKGRADTDPTPQPDWWHNRPASATNHDGVMPIPYSPSADSAPDVRVDMPSIDTSDGSFGGGGDFSGGGSSDSV